MNFFQTEKGKNVLTVLIVILVGLGGYGLGRLDRGSDQSGLKVEYPPMEAAAVLATPAASEPDVVQAAKTPSGATTGAKTSQVPAGTASASGGAFFASKIGHKYYPTGLL